MAHGSWLRAQGSGLRAQGSGHRAQGTGHRAQVQVQGTRYRAQQAIQHTANRGHQLHPWILLLIAIVGEVIGTTALKASEGFTRPLPSTIVVIGYGVAFYFLSLTLKTIPMGISYAIWSGVGIVLISLLGWIVFKQSLDAPALIGMGLIVAGVLVITVFSKTASH